MAQPVPVVGDGEPAGFLGEGFLALQGLELVFFGDLGGDHFQDVVREPAERDRVVLGGQADQVRFRVAAVLDRERVDALDDHDGLLFGDLAGGHRVPDRLVVVVQGVRELEAAFGVPFGLPGLVGPPGGGVGGTVVRAEVEVVGLVGDPELELGEPVPQRGHRGEGVGQFGVADRPQPRVPELVEVGVEPRDQGSDRVRLWFAEYRCHTGNSGIDHRQSRAQNRPRFRDVDKFFRVFLERSLSWSRQARPPEGCAARRSRQARPAGK